MTNCDLYCLFLEIDFYFSTFKQCITVRAWALHLRTVSQTELCFDWVGCITDRSSPAINLTVGLSDRPDYQLKLSATWDCYWCLAFKKKKERGTILLVERSRHWCNLSIVETLIIPGALSGQTNIYSKTEQTHSFTLALFSAQALLMD